MLLMIAVTVMLIGLTVGLPSVYQEAQREKEEELIFRGNEYARAIYLYNRQFHHYPSSVKDLLHTNNLSFLRHAYKDPMVPGGKWRFIHANGQGVVLDSLTLSATSPAAALLGQQSGTSSAFGQSSSSFGGLPGTEIPTSGGPQSTSSNFGSSFGQSSSGQSTGQSSFGSSFGSSGAAGGADQFGQATQPGQAASSEPGAGNETGDESGKKKKKKAPGCDQQGEAAETGPTSSFFSNSNQPQGVFIVGVASCSDRDSIRVWNKHSNYSEWEFLGVAYAPTGIGGVPSVTPQNGQPNPGGFGSQPGQPGFGQPGQPGFGPGQPNPPPLTDQPGPPEPDPEPTEPPHN